MDFTMTFCYVYLPYCTCLREAFILPSTVLSLPIFLHSSKSPSFVFYRDRDERKKPQRNTEIHSETERDLILRV